MDKTIASVSSVGARLSLKLTSPSFLEGSKLYSLYEGLHKMEFKSLTLKSSRRSCNWKGLTQSWKVSYHTNNQHKWCVRLPFGIPQDQMKGIGEGYDDKQDVRIQ